MFPARRQNIRYSASSYYNLSRFFENQPNEICSHLSEKASKGTGFLNPRNSKTTVNEGKRKEQKKERGEGKEEKRKKAMIPLFVFIKATLGIVFGRKGCRTQKGQFGKKGVY